MLSLSDISGILESVLFKNSTKRSFEYTKDTSFGNKDIYKFIIKYDDFISMFELINCTELYKAIELFNIACHDYFKDNKGETIQSAQAKDIIFKEFTDSSDDDKQHVKEKQDTQNSCDKQCQCTTQEQIKDEQKQDMTTQDTQNVCDNQKECKECSCSSCDKQCSCTACDETQDTQDVCKRCPCTSCDETQKKKRSSHCIKRQSACDMNNYCAFKDNELVPGINIKITDDKIITKELCNKEFNDRFSDNTDTQDVCNKQCSCSSCDEKKDETTQDKEHDKNILVHHFKHDKPRDKVNKDKTDEDKEHCSNTITDMIFDKLADMQEKIITFETELASINNIVYSNMSEYEKEIEEKDGFFNELFEKIDNKTFITLFKSLSNKGKAYMKKSLSIERFEKLLE